MTVGVAGAGGAGTTGATGCGSDSWIITPSSVVSVRPTWATMTKGRGRAGAPSSGGRAGETVTVDAPLAPPSSSITAGSSATAAG